MKTFLQWLEWYASDRDDYLIRRPHNRRQRANLEPAQYVSDSPRKYQGDLERSKPEFTDAVVDAIHKGLTRRQIIRHLNGKTNLDITRDQNALLNTVNDAFLKFKKDMPSSGGIQAIAKILKTVAHQTRKAPLNIPTPSAEKQYPNAYMAWRNANKDLGNVS